MSRPSRIAIVKELGSRSPRCLAAHAVRGQDQELVVAERYPASLGPETLEIIEHDAKELIPFEHTNVATMIAALRLKGDVAVLSEWVDGESLESVLASKPPLDVLLRMAFDVVAAVAALHASSAGRVSGALGSDDVFVGVDGVTRIARFGLGRVSPGALGMRRVASMAPEYLRGERAAVGDVFTVGTLLWECFMGARLFDDPASVDAHLARLEGRALQRSLDRSKHPAWAAGLADVIERALELEPAKRYATMEELSRALASAAGSNVAARAAVSKYVARMFGARVEARLEKLEPKVDISLSMNVPPMTTPPPAVVVEPSPKLPVVDAPKGDAPQAQAPKPEPKVEPPKAEPPKVEPPKAEPPKAAAPKIDAPKPEAPSNPKLPVAKAKDAVAKPTPAVTKLDPPKAAESPKPAEAAKLPPARKPAASTPNINVAAARKAAVPLPLSKRSPGQPDSAPSLATAPKAPASAPSLAAAPKAATSSPAIVVKANGGGHAPVAPALKTEPVEAPASLREELDVEIDLASVPPPAAAVVAAPVVAKPTPTPEPARAVPPVVAAKPVVAEAVVAPVEHVRESEFPRRNPYRGAFLVLGALLFFGGGFAVGRLTAPTEAPLSVTIAATTPSAPPSATETSAPPSTTAAPPTTVQPSATPTDTSSARPSTTGAAPAPNPTFAAPPRTNGTTGVTQQPRPGTSAYAPSGI